ncbi:hypothetical protein [Natrinema altunense]|uniref:Uncharacterized protein n=1 Tax=Natrinema altunense TaxID=222984 RepID=A0A482Y186_9EURY|nr:hypothetical protein [Natrinema altunense]RZH68064.1 hypothetical protein ELS17_00925 [Natrinema altunense]
MDRRDFLKIGGCIPLLSLSGCSALRENNETETTHRHLKSSSVWNGISSEVTQPIFIPELLTDNGRVELLITTSLNIPENIDLQPKETTVLLVLDDIVDEWHGSWGVSNQQT